MGINIISIRKNKYSNYQFSHTVICSSPVEPDAFDVACEVGYHPHGYGQCDVKVSGLEDGKYEVTWISDSNCE